MTIIYLPEESCKNLNLRKIAMKKGESTRQIFRLTSCRESPGSGGTLRSSSIGRRRPSPRWSSGAPPPRGPASPRRPTAPPRSGNRGRTTAGGPRNLCLKETGKSRLLFRYNFWMQGCIMNSRIQFEALNDSNTTTYSTAYNLAGMRRGRG